MFCDYQQRGGHAVVLLDDVFAKAEYISSEMEAKGIRKDACGALIKRRHYGDRKSSYGWEVDHIIPELHGGSNDLSNLQPLQWQNNVSKGSGRLVCRIMAVDGKNTDVKSPL